MKTLSQHITPCLAILSVAILALLPAACSDETELPHTSATITLIEPDGVESMNIVSQTLKLVNLSTGTVAVYDNLAQLTLTEGIYDITYSAEITYTVVNTDGETAEVEGSISGSEENVEFTGTSKSVAITTYLIEECDDFIFEEIFFSGTLRSSGSQYYGDGYFKIFNNTDHVLYADGVAFCESRFKSTLYYEYTPDIRTDTFTIWSLYVVPGSGTDHPVQPGESMIICDAGIDHRTANPNSFDLSAADFEWYDVSTSASNLDIDSETVPNLDKWYCYTLSFYILHNRGFTSFALARIPIDQETYLADYYYTYEYTMYTAAGTFYMTQSAYKMPNEWIIDGVNCSVESERAWNILPASVDAGWTHCGYVDKDESRYFRSIRRKLSYLNDDGTMHLQDTNNSTEDFNTECIPSIIEQQGTAIDAAGTLATTLTYDGVTPIEDQEDDDDE